MAAYNKMYWELLMSTLRDSNDKGCAMWLSTVVVKQPAQQDKSKNNNATRTIVVINY